MAEESREKLADYAHAAWSGWMKYIFSNAISDSELRLDKAVGLMLTPKWAVDRWIRQASTPYAEMPENEKGSDRDEADKILKIIQPYIDAAVAMTDLETVKSLLDNQAAKDVQAIEFEDLSKYEVTSNNLRLGIQSLGLVFYFTRQGRLVGIANWRE